MRLGGNDPGRIGCWLAALALAALAAVGPDLAADSEKGRSAGPGERGDPVRVTVATSHGRFALELYPELAPVTVERFLARADDTPHTVADDGHAGAEGGLASYAGLRVCESRPHGHLILGCRPPRDPALGPRPPRPEPPLPDEIDAVAMGLDDRILDEPARVNWLWQQEIYPRYRELRAEGRPVPRGLDELISRLEQQGPEATASLLGKSRLWYLRALGYEFDPEGSPLRFERGAVACASYWPGEADARFMIALTRIPQRDGRATVFGRVVSGWDAIERIVSIPVDKGNVPLEPVVIEQVRRR